MTVVSWWRPCCWRQTEGPPDRPEVPYLGRGYRGTGQSTEEGWGTGSSRTGQWFMEGPWVVICLLHVRKTCPGRPVDQARGFGHSTSLNSRETSGEHFQDLPVDSSLPSSPPAPRRALGWWAGDMWGCPWVHPGELGLQAPSPTLCPPLCVSLSLIKPGSPALQVDSSPAELPGKPGGLPSMGSHRVGHD